MSDIDCDSRSLMAEAKCFYCTIPTGMLGAVAIYLAAAWANRGITPGSEFVFGNPQEDWAFGDPGTGAMFGGTL